jgi:RNA polymerase sigma factor (sigma-70 family)
MSMIGIKVADLEVLPDHLVERYQKNYKKGRRHFLDKIVLHNMKLVIHLAHHYYPPSGYSHEDLIMSGTFGLYTAARKWQRSKGASFGTYASYHIKHHIRRFIQKNSQVVSVPFRFNDDLAAAHKEKRNLESSLGHGEQEDDGRLSSAAQRIFSRTATRVSLDGATDMDGDECTLDIPDPAGDAPVYGEEEYKILNNLIRELPHRLQEILRARFGFEDPEHIPTLEELGNRLHVTRERVRQLENAAVNKLKQRLRTYHKKYNLEMR